MSPTKPIYNLALVGGGRLGLALLEALVPPRKEGQPLRIMAVADTNPEAPGLIYAMHHNLFVTCNYQELFLLPELDLLVNATGRPEVAKDLDEQCPERVMVLSVSRPLQWEDFYDLIALHLAPVREVAPLKVGLVGAGKGGTEILQLLVGDERYRNKVHLIGVSDLNPEAPGLILAQKLGIPTYRECTALLEQQPDVILELTGDPLVRERIQQLKHPQTQIIDHYKARVFWDLLQKDREYLRSRVESEIKLAGQRSRFQKIFDNLPDPVLVLRDDYVVEEANLAFIKRFQKDPGEILGRRCYEAFHEIDVPCSEKGMSCPLQDVLKDGRTHQVLQCYPDDQGCMHYDEITMSLLFPLTGRRKRVIEIIKDITAQKELEKALQNSEEQARILLKQATKGKAFLETIVNGIEDHMMVIDLDYRVLEVNRALLEMVGLKREEVVGKHCYEVSHHLNEPCTIPDHPCPLKDAVASGKAASATHIHFDKDGREHYYHVVCHPLFDEDGRVRQVVDLSRDITQEIVARTKLLHDDKMTSLGKLSASVVHEINNPLTGILNLVKLMRRMFQQEPPSPEDLPKIQNYLDIIYNETSRVSKTVSNLLAFSRRTKPELEPLNLNDILEETLLLTEYQMRLQGIRVVRRFSPDLALVLADRGQMKQAFLNMILNAQDAMPQGGTLTLETRNTRWGAVRVKISDTGVGIPKDYFSQIFEPFFTTKKAGAGVGLGLSVVYGIIRDHKGSIKVDSVVGRGSTFSIFLPAYKPGEARGAVKKI
uniref:histidine kinase n=1 Tax=Desulfobacca acetoxidans TaxID=60893 RepID=A0A7V4G9D6_9BACT